MNTKAENKGFRIIFLQTWRFIVRNPVCWMGFFLLPLFCFLFLTDMQREGLPTQVPAAIIDKDGSALSREVSQTLAGMQMVDIQADPNSYTEARHLVQEGKIFGFFFIPENFQADLMAGRKPVITFYTNMTYFVPASLLFKTFKSTALYSKAGIAVNIIEQVGYTSNAAPLLQPVNVSTRPIGNPWLNYGIYLCNSFVPGVLQVMIFLMTCYTLGMEIKRGRSRRLLQLADGSVLKALVAKLLPQTIIWTVVALFMEVWLFKFNHYPMNGSWGWLTLSELMFVLASQGFALFVFGILPNMRLSLSVCALIGILSFSIAAFSFPIESMYGAISIFSWILPVRYNFLIYVDQALNGIGIFYSRWWYVAYIIFMLAPLPFLPRIKRAFSDQVYVP